MNKIRNFCILLTDLKNSAYAKYFEAFVLITIVFNALILGIQTIYTNYILDKLDDICLVCFAIEFVIRCIACGSLKNFLKKPLLIFDFVILAVCFIPEQLCNGQILTVLRITRVLRIIRLITINIELKTIIKVLIKSFSSITHTMILLVIFLYVFGIIGVHLFKMPDPSIETISPDQIQRLETFKENSNGYFVGGINDPYGNVFESMFTLFKTITGDDWTNLRNNQVVASEMQIISTPTWIITSFHILWFIFGAYLLMNLLVGAIINNYETISQRINDKDDEKILIKNLIKELENQGYIKK